MPGRSDPGAVSVSDLRMGTAGILEQQYFVKLRIQNPNNEELNLTGIAFELELNDKPFAKGTGAGPILVPRFGSQVVEVETLSTLTGLLRQLDRAVGGSGVAGKFGYRIKGRLHRSGLGRVISFDEKGELSMPGAPEGETK